MRLAGIKVWVLTGDKVDTAKNIGYSCKLLTHQGMELLEYPRVCDDLIAYTNSMRQKVRGVHAATGAEEKRTQDRLPDNGGVLDTDPLGKRAKALRHRRLG
jgi:magnesium-transporting ATPase (P-type)